MNLWLRRMLKLLERMVADSLRQPDQRPGEAITHQANRSLAELLALGDIEGRLDQRRAVQDALGRRPITHREPSIPEVRLEQQLADLRQRDPVFAHTAELVSEHYLAGTGFAAARAASETVARHVRDHITRGRAEGRSSAEITAGLVEIGNAGQRQARREMRPWTQAYAETVYRTNLTTSYVSGRITAARHPAMRRTLPAWRYETAGDGDVRSGRDAPENHAALDGMIRAVDWDGWRWWAPPGGYNCRCTLIAVTVQQLRRMTGSDGEPLARKDDERLHRDLYASAPSGARFHPGFQPKAWASI